MIQIIVGVIALGCAVAALGLVVYALSQPDTKRPTIDIPPRPPEDDATRRRRLRERERQRILYMLSDEYPNGRGY